MTSHLATVEQLLLKLTPPELAKVKLRVQFLLGASNSDPVPAGPPPPAVDWLLEGIVTELRRRGLLNASARLPARAIPDSYAAASAAVRKHLTFAMHRRMLNPELVALGRLAARALSNWMENHLVPIHPKSMLLNVDKTMAAVEVAFPGYLASGMLSIVLERPVAQRKRLSIRSQVAA